MDVLARSIADKAARADIEEFCDRQGEHYVAPDYAEEGTRREVLLAMTYLEMRGLLVCDPLRPEMVRLL